MNYLSVELKFRDKKRTFLIPECGVFDRFEFCVVV